MFEKELYFSRWSRDGHTEKKSVKGKNELIQGFKTHSSWDSVVGY